MLRASSKAAIRLAALAAALSMGACAAPGTQASLPPRFQITVRVVDAASGVQARPDRLSWIYFGKSMQDARTGWAASRAGDDDFAIVAKRIGLGARSAEHPDLFDFDATLSQVEAIQSFCQEKEPASCVSLPTVRNARVASKAELPLGRRALVRRLQAFSQAGSGEPEQLVYEIYAERVSIR